jgi:uncharacterized protein
MALVVDTGVIYAALKGKDGKHALCRDLLVNATESLVIPAPVLVELDYWIRKDTDAQRWLSFTESVVQGTYAVLSLDADALTRAARLQVKYADLPLGFVDASVMIACEILNETKVATLDRRHFGVVRTSSGGAFEIVPANS